MQLIKLHQLIISKGDLYLRKIKLIFYRNYSQNLNIR